MSAEEIGKDLLEAKLLLAKAKRPAVKAILSAFVREQTKKELELLGAAEDDEGEDPMLSEFPPDGPPNPAPPEPKPKPESAACPEVLEPAARKPPPKPFQRAEPALPSDVASPAPTKLVRAGGAPAAPTTGKASDWVVPGYGWEQGEYNSPWVNILISIEGVGAARDRCHCDFGLDSFDMRVTDVGGKNYRLFVEALDKDVVPEECRLIVKKNRVTVKLKKVKGEYSYDHWNDLKKKGGRAAKEKEKNKDPSAGIMDMMKDLYDNGDDNMRKIIGESMMKSARGEKTGPDDLPSSLDKPPGAPDYDLDKDDVDDFAPPTPGDAKGPPDFSKIPGMEDFKMADDQ